MARDYYARRGAKNERSRAAAEHHTEPWEGYELDLLLAWDGSDAELTDLAEMLGRTREACRQQFYISRSRGTIVHRETRTVTHIVETRWSPEDDDEWPSDWYVR